MESCFQAFQDQSHQIFITRNQNLNRLLQNFSFFHISETINEDLKKILSRILKKTKIIFINHSNSYINDDNCIYFYIEFKNTILFIKQGLITLLHELFSFNSEIKICFPVNNKTKEIFDQTIKLQYVEEIPDKSFLLRDNLNEMSNLLRAVSNNKQINFIIKSIGPLISFSLITQAYDKISKNRKNRMKYFISNYTSSSSKTSKNTFNYDDDFVFLCYVGCYCLYRINLVYCIGKQELMIIKSRNSYDFEFEMLFQREVLFYTEIKHPLLPNFYGICERKNDKIIITEFIKGKSLHQIKKLHLEIEDKMTIIFKIMIFIEYLHRNQYIYINLKPNNVMIDENKEIVFLGFSRAVKYHSYFDDEEQTRDFMSPFVAPEVNFGKFSYQCDIYSLGLMIKYIMKEENPEYKNSDDDIICQYPEINKMYKNCIKKLPEERPSISELILEFYFHFHAFIDIDKLLNVYEKCFSNIYDLHRIKELKEIANNDHEDADFKLGMLYYEGELYPFDIYKSINYFSHASKKNCEKAKQILDIISENNQNFQILIPVQLRAQINLGYFYQKQNEINKAIHFFTLAANQNNSESQHQLGLIYYENKFIERDINKAIYYFTLAANQNNPDSQHYLGLIYYENKYIQCDINKAIHYFTLAANQNFALSQHQLGLIYYENKFILRDILKAIHFFSLADKQNFVESQLILGHIYYENKFVKRDPINVIYYYSRAAEQSNVEALRFLGFVYINNEIVYPDIQNSIYYFTHAANQNCALSQYQLGLIYYENKLIERDINKAILYFMLAANHNNPDAQFILGVIYFEGKYVSLDLDKAKSYFSIAAKQNHQNLIFYLTKINQ